MSKKPSISAKQAVRSSTLSLKRGKAEDQQLVQNLEGLGSLVQAQGLTGAPVVSKAGQKAELQAEVREENQLAGREDVAQDADSAAHAEALFAAVQDNGGQSLLVDVAAAGTAKEEKDDKAGAWQWSDALPWLAALGGVAALAGLRSDSSDPSPTSGTGASGVVFDTPVSNAIVFRDSNGNGMWDAGEAITKTDESGRFSSLGGSGAVVATSLDRLVGKAANGDITEYTSADTIILSDGRTATGYAIDIGADGSLGTADDFVWSGTYTSTSSVSAGSVNVYVSAVSTLVSAYLAEKGIASPSESQVSAAIAELKALFAYDETTGINGDGDNIKFLTSELNGQITKIMGEAAAKAQAAGTNMQDAVEQAVAQLAQAAFNGVGAAEGMDLTFDADNKIDLTSVEHLQEIFDLDAIDAGSLALLTANPGPAVYSIWFTEAGSAVATPVDSGEATIETDGPVGNITVISKADESTANLTVSPESADAVQLQGSHLLVAAAGDRSEAELTLDATGDATDIVVDAQGGSGAAAATVTLDGNLSQGVSVLVSSDRYEYTSREVQELDLGGADAPVAGDVITLVIDNETLEYTVAEGDNLASIVAALNALAEDFDVGAVATLDGDIVSIEWVDTTDHDPVTLTIAHETAEEVFSATGTESVDGDGNETQTIDLSTVGSFEENDVIDLVVGDDTLSYTVTADDVTNSTAVESALAAFATQATEASLDVVISAEADVLSIVWADGVDHAEVAFSVTRTTIAETGITGTEEYVAGVQTIGDPASAQLDLAMTGDIAGGVLVSATGEDAIASGTFTMDGTLAGNIKVEATASGACADADFNASSADTLVTLDGVNITVSAEGSNSYAGAHLHDAGGTADMVRVSATGDDANAYLHLRNEGASADLLSVVEISVNADSSGNCGDVSSQAGLEIDGNMAVTGEISVTAAGSSDAAYISADTSQLTLGVAATSEDAAIVSNISVTASGESADASATLGNATGDVGTLSTTASGAHSTASLSISNSGSDGELVLHGVPGTVTTVVPGSVFFQTDSLSGTQGLAYTGYTGVSSEIISADATPDFSGTSANVDYTWASADVLNSGASDDVQVHWTGFIRWPGVEGELTAVNFRNSSDDGFILKLNGSAVIENWEEQGDKLYNGNGSYEAVAGDLVQVDIWYYENGGGAVAKLYWDQPTPPVSIDVSASEYGATATTTVCADVSVDGAINVEASAESADAHLSLTDLGSTDSLGGGDINVTASGYSSDAGATLHTVSGTVGAVNVTASGYSGDAHLNLDVREVAQLEAASLTVTASNESADASADISGNVAITGDISVEASDSGADASAHINTTGSGSTVLGVAATSEDAAVGTNITVSASGSDTEANAYIHNASGTVGAIGVTSSANLGDASLTLLTGSDDVTIGSVTMLTTDNGWASADIHGNVAIDGDITVTASGSGGQASADINNWTDDVGSTALGGGDITILASGDNAEASADIRLASGTVNDISVTVSGNGNQTDASLNLQTEGDGLTAASLTVTATGTDSAASADISGDMAITGDISVSATASGSCADVEINTSGSGATVLGVAATSEDAAIGSNITVSADVATATAVLNIGNASGTIESLAVTANDGTASLDIGVADESTLTINTVDVTSNGTGHASADVHGSADSTVAITGNVTVSANGALDPATLYVNGTDVNGATVLGTSADTAANDISVTASTGAEAYAYLNNASGQADELTVTAENGNADAGLDVGVASGDSLNVASLSVTASGSNDSAGANLWNHGASSELAITGSITVSAGGDSAHAYGDVNAVDWERDSEGTWTSGDAQGHVVLGVAGEAEVINLSYDVANNVVGGHLVTTITATADVLPGTAAVGADLTVEASGASADAAADIRNASGTVANISVTASSTDASAGLYLQTESYNGADGVTAASLAVTASGDDADASADISGDVAITGAISITASADGADATANLNTSGSGRTVLGVAATPEIAIETTVLVDAQIVETRTEVVRAGTAAVGSDLTVTASGASADASADLRNVSGIVEDITVTASGICSDAYLNLHIEDGEWLQAASLTVQADVYADESSNDAEAVISGNITIAGDIIVSGGDDVDADINTDGAGHTVLGGGNITVTADGDDSDADADIRNASGTVGDIRVTAGDLGDDADADLNLATESYDGVDGVTAASLTVEALGDSTDATAEINGVIAFTGDLRVVASDDSADASAHINTGGGADEYQEFFLPAVFGINGWSYASGDVLDVVVDGYTLSYTIGSMDSPWSWAQSLNVQADNLGLAVDFGMCGDVVLEAQWNDGRNHDLLQFSHNGNTGELADSYIEQDGFSANASTVLGADGEASDITVSATSASADADAYVYQVSGSAGSIEVLAQGYDADAYLDLRVASGEQLESGNVTVIASNTDGTAQIDINGNLVVNGDISVSATGDSSSADAEINNAGFNACEDTVYAGETSLQGGDISVTASGDGADARAWVHNASGTLGDLNVVASDTGANATLDLKAQATGQHQLQIITLTEAELSALGERDTLGVWIDGTYFEADLAQAFYTSNSDKLAEFVQAIRNDGNYADLNADVYQEGNSLVIRWHDYENHADPRQVEINGIDRGFSQSVNAVAPSLAFDNSSDVWVSASSSDAQAHAAVDSVAGTLGNTYVFASGDSNAHASLTMGLNGDLSGDVVVVADGVYNSATLDLHADASGRISLGSFNCQDVVVAAHGLGAQADASLSGLSGTLDDLTVVADVKNAEASANLQFAEGSLNYACMDAVDHQSTVRVTLDQTVQHGSVYVAGEGHAAVSFYVDERNATADQVNLWGMHNGDRSYHERGGDWWGYADIDLVARYNDVLDQPGAGLQTSCNDTLWDTRMTVYGFNVERDSINVIVQADDCGHLGTQDQLVRHDVAFLHEGDTTVAEAAFDAAIDDLLADARWYFDNYTGDAEQGYYYRQITLDPDVGSNYVRSFLVYDYDLGGDNVGASGLVALSDTTGLNERNVADRYDIVSQTEGYVSQSTDLAGAHAIDSLTVGAYEDGQNDQTYVVSHDADVMVSDITVEAINPGLGYGWDDTAYASLNMASQASDGCGDSWLELRQSDVNVIARGDDGEYAYADAYLSLRDAWGTLNSVTVEASNNAQASADLAYLSYWSDYDSLGSVKVHDMDVRAMDDNADATLSTVSSDLTFDYSVVNVTAGYDAQGNAEGAYESDARLYVNRYVDGDHRCGDVDGVISELNVRVDGDNSSALADLHRYAGDIGLLRVTADGYHSSADADVLFDNSMGAVNAVHEIYVRADGEGTDARASIDTTSSSNDIQLTGGDIYVGAFDSADASLDMTSAPLSGQASQIVVEANDSADARAWISGHDFSVTHERTSTDTWNDSSIRVSAGADSDARLAISGYGQYLDSVVLAAGESSDVYFSLDMTGFIDTLDIQVTGDNSYVSADIAQATYGGVVNVDGSANYYSSDALDEVIHENNVVDLAYRTATASEINIDNTGRDFERGGYAYDGGWYFASGDYDDTLQLNLLLDVADQDIPYTSQATLLAYRVQIDGWTDNDTISFAGESGDAGYNYEENWSEVSLTQLFRDADAALDGTVDYYFGVVDGNGYLFHDEDGVGITTVVELMGVTAFDYHQINGTAPI